MNAPFEAKNLGSRPETLAAVAAHVQREYGENYRIAQASAGVYVSIFEIGCSDGSRFNLVGDKWGNVKRADPETRESVLALAEQMSHEATTA